MIGFVKLMVFGFIGLSIVYLILRVYLRSVRREDLEKEWDANPPEGQGETERGAFIEEGMRTYNKGLHTRLLWLVYIIPMVALAVIIYIINFQ
jgi:hypothetical protein